MFKKISQVFLLAILGAAMIVPSAGADLVSMGEPIDPHGFPSFYGDSDGLQLEPCLPAPAGFATRPELCVFDPLDETSDLVVAGEIFWWLASSTIDFLPSGGRAVLTLGIEGTFGGIGAAVDGQQISFARTRVRVDTPVAGTYTVTHPYGTLEFEVTEANLADGINYTADIGAKNFLDPASGFLGALAGGIGPFLTWPNYELETDLQVLLLDGEGNPVPGDDNGFVVLEQYVGDPLFPHEVVGSPIVNQSHASGFQNFFRVDGPAGSNLGGPGVDFVQTDLFGVSGKVFDVSQPRTPHVFPEPPLPKLFGMGPVNRVEPFALPTTAEVTGADLPYPVGYPIWYQENVGTIAEPVGGLRLTLCDPGTMALPLPGTIQAMCISDPIDPTDEAQTALRTGGEGFWWSADAIVANGDDNFALGLALEATFGGTEAITDGNQITFGRERIRIDTNVSGAGTYRITHPYGVRILEAATADDVGINVTSDIGIVDPADPDGALIGAIYSDVGPSYLTWTTFNENPALNDPALIRNHPTIPGLQVHFVGDPAIAHEVVGSPTGNNLFRVEKLVEGGTVPDGPWQLLGETNLFNLSGQVFDPVALGLPPEGVVASSLGVFRNGTWYLDGNANDAWDSGIDFVYTFGQAGDLPVAGDWNGDGSEQIGVFRNGTWYLDADGNGAWGAGLDSVFKFGQAGDLPVAGDWNGDGSEQIGVFRNGTWYLDADGNGAWGAGLDSVFKFGQAGDLPVVGDWNGDGSVQIGVFRNGTWYLDADGNGAWDAGIDISLGFGQAGDRPVAGSW